MAEKNEDAEMSAATVPDEPDHCLVRLSGYHIVFTIDMA
jgi:hypothetical protein